MDSRLSGHGCVLSLDSVRERYGRVKLDKKME